MMLCRKVSIVYSSAKYYRFAHSKSILPYVTCATTELMDLSIQQMKPRWSIPTRLCLLTT